MSGTRDGASEDKRKRKRDATSGHSLPSGDKRHKTQDTVAIQISDVTTDSQHQWHKPDILQRNRIRKEKRKQRKKLSTETPDLSSREARRAHKKRVRKLQKQVTGEETAQEPFVGGAVLINGFHEETGVAPTTYPEHEIVTQDTALSKTRWSISSPRGGAFLDRDPIFLKDSDMEEYLVTSVGNTVEILSVSNSLVIATLEAATGIDVVSIDAIITDEENFIRIIYSNGTLTDWDWKQDVSEESALAAKHVHTCKVATVGANIATVLASTVTNGNRSTSQILMNGIPIYECKHVIRDIQVHHGTDILIAFCEGFIIFGNKVDADKHAWTELPAPAANSFDVRYSTSGEGSKTRHRLALALGQADGKILYHHDIWPLIQSKQATLSQPQILHWHRQLNTVKFSRDGNYLISGGGETTLVWWQLATGSKQFLPNLTANILRIVVNAAGDKYALCMADNSIMVLSTSERKPVANFSGLQLVERRIEDDTLPCAAISHPTKKDQILLAVPASHTTNSVHQLASEPRPFLQTFNVGTLNHVTRQALTRNNVTDFNTSPDGTAIEAPDVTHIAISHDGQWLASIDEWTPPSNDLQHESTTGEEVATKKEVYLKIWQWDESAGHWMLNTRFDTPHARSTLAIVKEPTLAGFITIGEDAVVRVWRPKKKTRYGVPLFDAQGQIEIEWHCKRETELTHDGEIDEPESESHAYITAALAISEDGSLITASISTDENQSPAIFFINNNSDMTWSCRYNIATTAPISLSFIGSSLVVASSTMLRVWNVIDERMQSSTKIGYSVVGQRDSGDTFMLATNSADKSALVVTSMPNSNVQCLRIIDLDGRVEFASVMEKPVAAVLVQSDQHGYTVLFSDASISDLKSLTSPNQVSLQSEAFHTQPNAEIAMIEEERRPISTQLDAVNAVKTETVERQVEDDRSVVRPEHLAEIFETGLNSSSLLSVHDMFSAITGLFGRKPLSKPLSL